MHTKLNVCLCICLRLCLHTPACRFVHTLADREFRAAHTQRPNRNRTVLRVVCAGSSFAAAPPTPQPQPVVPWHPSSKFVCVCVCAMCCTSSACEFSRAPPQPQSNQSSEQERARSILRDSMRRPRRVDKGQNALFNILLCNTYIWYFAYAWRLTQNSPHTQQTIKTGRRLWTATPNVAVRSKQDPRGYCTLYQYSLVHFFASGALTQMQRILFIMHTHIQHTHSHSQQTAASVVGAQRTRDERAKNEHWLEWTIIKIQLQQIKLSG